MEHEKDNKRHADDHDHGRDQSPDEIAPHLRVEVRFRWGWPCSCREKGVRGYSRVVGEAGVEPPTVGRRDPWAFPARKVILEIRFATPSSGGLGPPDHSLRSLPPLPPGGVPPPLPPQAAGSTYLNHQGREHLTIETLAPLVGEAGVEPAASRV